MVALIFGLITFGAAICAVSYFTKWCDRVNFANHLFKRYVDILSDNKLLPSSYWKEQRNKHEQNNCSLKPR
jgi:hypothetical protein